MEIARIDPPKDVTDAMHRQMKAERERRAMVLEAEGAREAAVKKATGDKKLKYSAPKAKRRLSRLSPKLKDSNCSPSQKARL